MIPVADPGRSVTAEVEEAVARVVWSGRYVLGPEVAAFEREFADYLGAAFCVGVGNGTDALQLALQAVGLRQGDSVLVAANAGGYASTAARSAGFRVMFADPDRNTLNLTAAGIEAACARWDVRAVVVTHLYGLPAWMRPIVEVCRDRDVALVEDCAQAAGATVDGRRVGTFGDAAAFSFYPTKNLGALGDGGAVVTSQPLVADRLVMLRQYGWPEGGRDVVETGGRNSRLDEVQAAILRAKLPGLDAANERRVQILRRYADAAPESIGRMHCPYVDGNVAHLSVLKTVRREQVADALRECGVETAVHYPIPDHRQPAWAADHAALLPVSEWACDSVLSLPCFPELTDDEVDRVCVALASLDRAACETRV